MISGSAKKHVRLSVGTIFSYNKACGEAQSRGVEGQAAWGGIRMDVTHVALEIRDLFLL